MANNLFVSYDLISPGQHYDDVIAAIKEQGSWAKVHYSLFFLSTNKTAKEVRDAVWAKMDGNDKLLVIDATNNSATWQNLSDKVTQFIRDHWTA